MSKIRLLSVEECLMVTGGNNIYKGLGEDGKPRYFVPGNRRPYKRLNYVRDLNNGQYEDAEIIDCGTESEALSRAMQEGARQQGLGNIARFFAPVVPTPPAKRPCLITDFFKPVS